MITYPVRIDFKGQKTLETDIVFTSGDVQAYRLQFFFYDEGLYNSAGCSLMLKGKRSDGEIIIDRGTVDENGCIFYDVKSSFYQVAGKLSVEVALIGGEDSYITVKEVIFNVREGYGEGELAENTMPLLTELETALQETDVMLEQVAKAMSVSESVTENEKNRVAAETERAAAEERRIKAEEQRISKEQEREQLTIETEKAQQAAKTAAETAMSAAEMVGFGIYAGAVIGKESAQAVFMDDVSPLAHVPVVVVSGVESLENVTLIQTRKNLSKPFDYSFTESTKHLTLTISDNLFTLDGNSTNAVSVNKETGIILPPGTYTFSNQYIGGTCVNTTGSVDAAFYFVVRNKTGKTLATFSCYGKNAMMSTRSATFTLTETTEIRYYFTGAGEYEDYQSRIMINVGETAEPYEDYAETRYSVNTDGMVDNVALFYPYTSLLPDTNGAVVSCEYNKDTNKVIEKLTNAIISLGGNV